jgi:hypothetical protein
MGVDAGERCDLELVSRNDCHLCDEMKALLDRVLVGEGIAYRIRDVDADPELQARYTDLVPVLLRDGRLVAKLRLTESRLRRILRRRR